MAANALTFRYADENTNVYRSRRRQTRVVHAAPRGFQKWSNDDYYTTRRRCVNARSLYNAPVLSDTLAGAAVAGGKSIKNTIVLYDERFFVLFIFFPPVKETRLYLRGPKIRAFERRISRKIRATEYKYRRLEEGSRVDGRDRPRRNSAGVFRRTSVIIIEKTKRFSIT